MSKAVHLEYYAKNLCFDPKSMSDDDPDRTKLLKAIALLERADKCKNKRNAEKLNAQELAAIKPLELEIHGGSILEDLPSSVLFNDKNSDVSMQASGGGLRMSYSIRFSARIDSDITEDTYEEYLGDNAWQWVGIRFASSGYEGDSGSSMSYSIGDDE